MQEMRSQTQDFATALLDHARTSNELEIMLNYEPDSLDPWEPTERQTLDRLKLAIKYKQKKVLKLLLYIYFIYYFNIKYCFLDNYIIFQPKQQINCKHQH